MLLWGRFRSAKNINFLIEEQTTYLGVLLAPGVTEGEKLGTFASTITANGEREVWVDEDSEEEGLTGKVLLLHTTT